MKRMRAAVGGLILCVFLGAARVSAQSNQGMTAEETARLLAYMQQLPQTIHEAIQRWAESGQSPKFFILSAPAVEQICARHDLILLTPYGYGMEGATPSEGRYLVLGPSNLPIADIEDKEPDLKGIEPLRNANIPTTTDPVLEPWNNGLQALAAETRTVSFFGDTVWRPYVDQLAFSYLHTGTAQDHVTGQGVIVAVIDTGMDPNHGALARVLVPGYDFVNEDPYPSEMTDLDEETQAGLEQSTVSFLDMGTAQVQQSTVAFLDQSTIAFLDGRTLPPAFGHGTMVAGLVHLVAPNARIMPLKAFGGDGSGHVWNIVRAIRYAVDHGAHVINMSFSLNRFSAELMNEVNRATRRGVVCVASVGNNGEETLVFPAGFANVMGVASTNDLGERSTFSNYGEAIARVNAPGEALITSYPGDRYAAASGTSFAAPLVSGAAALLQQMGPGNQYFATDSLTYGRPSTTELGAQIAVDAALDRRSKTLVCQ